MAVRHLLIAVSGSGGNKDSGTGDDPAPDAPTG
jgi:hypothetical protein